MSTHMNVIVPGNPLEPSRQVTRSAAADLTADRLLEGRPILDGHPIDETIAV